MVPPVANTYTQIYIQVVFAVEGRQNLLPPEHSMMSGLSLRRTEVVRDVFADTAPDGAPTVVRWNRYLQR